MTNVVALHPDDKPAVQEVKSSPLMFTAYERPLYYKGSEANGAHEYSNTAHKALVRMVDGNPVCLNVVRDTYKVVQNAELFAEVHQGLERVLTHDNIKHARINDKMAYNGTQCMREYVFNDIAFDGPQDKIAFRIIVVNGFGTGAIKLYAGAIDFFCMNGMVVGDYINTYAKHTSGLKINKFGLAVEQAASLFWKHRDLWADLPNKRAPSDDSVETWLKDHFGERLGTKLMHQYRIEQRTRGHNLWALYSALTYYSSHTSGDFSLRDTGNDHAAATMLKREEQVKKVVPELMELAA